MVDYEMIGGRIKTCRLQNKLTQESLAEICGITVEYLSKIENGKAKPTIDTLGNICDALGSDMSYLFSGSLVDLSNYKLDDISRYYKDCKPEIKPIALEIVKKLARIK